MKLRNFAIASALIAASISGAKAQDATLKFWTWHPSEPVLNKIIDGFEQENPGVEIELQLFESSAYQDRLPLALASGDELDIVAVQTSTMVELVKDQLAPIEPLFDEYGSMPITDLLSESAIGQGKTLASDRELYIAPMGVLGSVVAYYNMDLMNELGLAIPRNRADLQNLVEVTTAKRPDLVPVSFTGAGWFLDEISTTIAEQVSPGFFNSVRYNEGGRWDDTTYLTAFGALVDLYKDGIFSKDTLDLDYGRSVELFQQGQAVMFLQGSWESGVLSAPFREANGVKLENVSASALPTIEQNTEHSVRAFIEVGLAVPNASQHKELATKFVEYVVAGNGVDAWSDTLFVVPSKVGFELADGIFSTDEARRGYNEISHLLLNPGSHRNNVSDFSNVVGDTIVASIIGETDYSEQVKYLQREWESGRYSNAE
jgi:raffinose/stachyose/melibiose transport system substrate-binding protein